MARTRTRAATRVVAAALSATVLTLTACTQDAENAQNAVATGGEFEFISPGGERIRPFPWMTTRAKSWS